jgi:hypothetical protein
MRIGAFIGGFFEFSECTCATMKNGSACLLHTEPPSPRPLPRLLITEFVIEISPFMPNPFPFQNEY